MPDFRDLGFIKRERHESARPQLEHGIIAASPDDFNTPVGVILPDFNDTDIWGPYRWTHNGNAMPQQGDQCLVAYSNRREGWVVAYWPSYYSPPSDTDYTYRTIHATVDGGGSVLSSGVAGEVMPHISSYAFISDAFLLADQAGNVSVDLWKTPYSSYPPTVSNSITATRYLTLSSAQESEDYLLYGWNRYIYDRDTLRFNIRSVSTIKRLDIILHLYGPA